LRTIKPSPQLHLARAHMRATPRSAPGRGKGPLDSTGLPVRRALAPYAARHNTQMDGPAHAVPSDHQVPAASKSGNGAYAIRELILDEFVEPMT
jgi:hypothetical protein